MLVKDIAPAGRPEPRPHAVQPVPALLAWPPGIADAGLRLPVAFSSTNMRQLFFPLEGIKSHMARCSWLWAPLMLGVL